MSYRVVVTLEKHPVFTYILRWDGRDWTVLSPLNIAREGPGVVGHAGHLYVVGGRGSGGSVERYDPSTDTWTLLDIKLRCPEQEYSAVILDRVV